MSRSQPSSSGPYCAMNHSRSYSGCGGNGGRCGSSSARARGACSPGSVTVAVAGTTSGAARPASLPRRQRRHRAARCSSAIDVDVRFERQRRIEHRLDALLAVLGERRRRSGARAPRPARGYARPPSPSSARTARCASRNRRGPSTCAITSTFSGERVGVRPGTRGTGSPGKHHLEDPRVPHVAPDQLVDVAHAERPVRHAHRQPVHRRSPS